MFRRLDSFSDVGITRRHWMPASAVKDCCNPECSLKFTGYHRKHHCRCCGNVFCTACASYSMPLDPSTGQMSTNGVWAKVCILCYEMGIEDGLEQLEASDASDTSDGEADKTPPDSLEDAVFRRRPSFLKSLSASKPTSSHAAQVNTKQDSIPRTLSAPGAGIPGAGLARTGPPEARPEVGQIQPAACSVAINQVSAESKESPEVASPWRPRKLDADILMVLQGAKNILERGDGEDLAQNHRMETSTPEAHELEAVLGEGEPKTPAQGRQREADRGSGTPSLDKGNGGSGFRLGPHGSSPLSGPNPGESPHMVSSLGEVRRGQSPQRAAQSEEGMSPNHQRASQDGGSKGTAGTGSRVKGSGLTARRSRKLEELPVSFGMPVRLWNATPERNLESPASVLDRPMEGSPSTDVEASTSNVESSDGDSALPNPHAAGLRSQAWDEALEALDPSRLSAVRSRSFQPDDSAGSAPDEHAYTLGFRRQEVKGRRRSVDGGPAERGSMAEGRLDPLQIPWEPRVSDRLRELHDLWEQRIRKKYGAPLMRSKSAKLNIHGLQVKSNGSPRMFAIPPTSPSETSRHTFFPSPSRLYRSRTLSPRGAVAHQAFRGAMDEELPPSASASASARRRLALASESTNGKPADVAPIWRSRSMDVEAGSYAMSQGIPEEQALEPPKSPSDSVHLENRTSLQRSMGTVDPGEPRDRMADAVESSSQGKERLPAGGAQEDAGERRGGPGGVTRWTVADVCRWLQSDVPFDSDKISEYVAAFERAAVGGLRLLGLHRDDPACEGMTDDHWAIFKAARWRLLAINLAPAQSKLSIAIPEREPEPAPEPDEAPDLRSPVTDATQSPYSPQSPALSDGALWSPVRLPDGEAAAMDANGNTNWLWSLVVPTKSDKSELEATAAMMEVQMLRGEIVATEEREVTVRAQLSHLDEVLRNAQLAEYLSTRTRWSALPGEIPVADSDVDDWLPRFVVFQGTTLSFFLKATELRPQATVNLRAAVDAGPMAPSEHSAGNSDGQWRAFYVLSEHGMRLECSTRNHIKFELWLSSILEAMERGNAAAKRPTSGLHS